MINCVGRISENYPIMLLSGMMIFTCEFKLPNLKLSSIELESPTYSDTAMMDEGNLSIQVWARRSLGEDDFIGTSSASVDVSSLSVKSEVIV
jgi:hypothetical protein